MAQMITCINVGQYGKALTRGKQYELLSHNPIREQLRIRGDNDRTRTYPAGYFDLDGGFVVSLVEWRFDDPVVDSLNGRDETNNYVDIVMTFSDGTKRWASLMTPDYIKALLEPRNDPSEWGGCYKPALWGAEKICIRDLNFETVDWTLRYMDAIDQLIQHSGLVGNDTDDDIADEETGE